MPPKWRSLTQLATEDAKRRKGLTCELHLCPLALQSQSLQALAESLPPRRPLIDLIYSLHHTLVCPLPDTATEIALNSISLYRVLPVTIRLPWLKEGARCSR